MYTCTKVGNSDEAKKSGWDIATGLSFDRIGGFLVINMLFEYLNPCADPFLGQTFRLVRDGIVNVSLEGIEILGSHFKGNGRDSIEDVIY
jgi:hypothetical protein